MRKEKISLVLEGGGMRGAYTAGALSWLIDHEIGFDSAYGISTGAFHLCNYLIKSRDNLFNFSTKYINDKRAIGTRSILRSFKVVDYDFLFDELLKKELKFDVDNVNKVKTKAYVGLYELDKGKTEYTPVQSLALAELKAACSLPIIGKVVEYKGRHLLDGGITEMIPINEAIKDGNTKHLIITTKPADYVRKPSKSIVVNLMKQVYPKWPSVYKDYKIRHLNYEKQIKTIKELEKDNKAIYLYPSKSSNVSRLGGSHEELVELYNLGYNDMENRKAEILAFLK